MFPSHDPQDTSPKLYNLKNLMREAAEENEDIKVAFLPYSVALEEKTGKYPVIVKNLSGFAHVVGMNQKEDLENIANQIRTTFDNTANQQTMEDSVNYILEEI